MQLIQAYENTWYLADWQLIPLYRVDEHRCILLDSGMVSQRQDIEDCLAANGLTPIGILGTHAHTDHSPNHAYFQKKYGIPVAMPLGEAGLCATRLNLKAYFFMLTPQQTWAESDVRQMELTADLLIPEDAGSVHFCGVEFGIVRTPGHSPSHICIRTPDDVLYLGDAILTGAEITEAKLPYFFSHGDAFRSMEKLREEKALWYLAAHRGLYRDITHWIDENISVVTDRSRRIASLITRPMTMDEIYREVCRAFRLLTSNPSKASLYERNIRIYVEYLRDTKAIPVVAREGVLWYGPWDPSQS